MKPYPKTTLPKVTPIPFKLLSHLRTFAHFHICISSRPSQPSCESSAFSLTEVVIAMGVAAVAFTSIIALFPLGLNMSKESYEDTPAALLAQTIIADFRDVLTGSSTNTLGPTSGYLIQVGPLNSPTNFSANNPANYINILQPTTTNPTTTYIAYNQEQQPDTFNREVRMLRPFINSSNETAFYTTGRDKTVAIAKITLQYCCGGLNSTASLTNGPIRIDIAIETPGNLPAEKRKQLLFTGGVN